MDKSIFQLFLTMRSCESLLRGTVRVDGNENHDFILEQLRRANELMTEFNQVVGTDRYWQDEMVADETLFALEDAVSVARDHLRASFKKVN